MKKIIAIALIVSLFTANAFAAPTRSSHSQSLDPTYAQPLLYNNTIESSDSYEDDFILLGSATPGTYEVTYSSDDPITIVSLAGGRISLFERTNNGANVKIQFTVPGETEGVNSYLYFILYTTALYDEAANASGLLAALTGSWFDGLSAHPVSYPFFSDEGHDVLAITFLPTKLGINDTLRVFLPQAALNYVNDNKTLSVDDIRVVESLSPSGDKEVSFSAAQSTDGGALISVNHTFQESGEFNQLHVSALGKTGLFARGKESAGSTFSLTAVVEGCTDGSKLKIERRLESAEDFSRFKNVTLTNCEAVVSTKLNETAQYRFKVGKKFYTKKVKIRKK